MSVPRFFARAFAAVGRHVAVDRETMAQALADRVIHVRCGRDCDTLPNARWSAELLVNLVARLYPRISISGGPSICESLATLAKGINPTISIEPLTQADAVTVVIGSDDVPGAAIFVRSDGWTTTVTDHAVSSLPGPPNPYAAAAGAAIAAAEVFRRVFSDRLPEGEPLRQVRLSLLDFGDTEGADLPLGETPLGDVALVGLGAVANGAMWALARHRTLTGRAWLVDPERIELSNLQRYVLTSDSDVGRSKVDIAAALLSGTSLTLEPREETLETFADSFPDSFAVRTVCISVDNVASRRRAQALLPELVLNGWTGETALGASWHIFDSEAACLACSYQPTGVGKSQTELVAEALGLGNERVALLWVTGQAPSREELAGIGRHLGLTESHLEAWICKPLTALYSDVVCGAVPVDVRGIGRLEAGPLAPQSALAGALLGAELVKRRDPGLAERAQRETVVLWDDVLRRPPARWAYPRARAEGCICGDPTYQEVFKTKWR